MSDLDRMPRLIVIPEQPLGHELHVSRCIVVDMLCKNVFSPESGDAIVTSRIDRKFLYERLVGKGNVTAQADLTPEQAGDYFVIDLRLFSMPPTICTFNATRQMRAVGYEIPNEYFTENFISKCSLINYVSTETIDSTFPKSIGSFVVIHDRFSAANKNILTIIEALPEDLVKIVFGPNMNNLLEKLTNCKNVYITNNLQVYATLLHDERCRLLISEWSGGGQLAQYAMREGRLIWYYFETYPDVYNYVNDHKIWEAQSLNSSYLTCWDFKQINGCVREYFESLPKMIEAITQRKVAESWR